MAYAEIALRVDDDIGEVIATITYPRVAWMIRSYGSHQSGNQSVIKAELTLAKSAPEYILRRHCMQALPRYRTPKGVTHRQEYNNGRTKR